MRSSNFKAFTVLFLISAGIIISIAATKPINKNAVNKTVANNDTGFFKNLQVLPKNISKDSLDKIMDGFKAALGVKCGFCHAFDSTTHRLNFPSDEKEEKGIARYMMRMTRSIDSTYFNFEKSTRPDTITVIKCFTCHRGSPHPDEASMGNMQENNNMPPPPPGQMPAPPPPGNDSSKPHKH